MPPGVEPQEGFGAKCFPINHRPATSLKPMMFVFLRPRSPPPSGYRSRRNRCQAAVKKPAAPGKGSIDFLIDAPRAIRIVRVQRDGAVIAPAKVKVGQRAFKHDHPGWNDAGWVGTQPSRGAHLGEILRIVLPRAKRI